MFIRSAIFAVAAVTVGSCTVQVPSPGDSTTDPALAETTAVNDPLSRPAEPTLSPSSFRSAAQCGACHPNHFEQWPTSMHAYATKDIFWRALVAIRQQDFDGARDQFCLQCHSAIATRGGEVYPGFSFDDFSPISLEGVTCEACHKVASLAREFNSGHVLDEDGPIRGPIADPNPNSFHESEFSPLHDESRYFGGCHDIIEQHNLHLERPYMEWLTSPAAAEGRNCQSCHMPSYTGKAASVEGVPNVTTSTSSELLEFARPVRRQ